MDWWSGSDQNRILPKKIVEIKKEKKLIGGMDEIKIECFRVYFFKVKQLKGKKKKKNIGLVEWSRSK